MTNAKRKTNVKERYEGQTGQLFQNKNQQGEVRSCKTHIRTENCMILEQNVSIRKLAITKGRVRCARITQQELQRKQFQE